MFQSTTAESIGHSGNSDPYPYEVVPGSAWPEIKPDRVDKRGTAAALMYVRGFDGEVHYRPRPEFDRPPVNPILDLFREAIESGLYEEVYLARLWVDLMGDGYTFHDEEIEPTEAEIAHAHRVLSLLVSVSG